VKHIILDKSYLDAATPEQIHALCTEHRVLMPDVLFYELTTTEETSMKNCFNKFPDTTNPVELIPNVGTLLSYELTMRTPCTPLYDRRLREVFTFNSRLRTGMFEFTETQLETKRDRAAIVEKDTKEFFDLAMMIAAFFPEISGIPYPALPSKIEAAKTQVATDIFTVRRIYEKWLKGGRIPNPVLPDTLNPNWAYFRWVQVRCLYSLDLIFRYDGHLPQDPSAKFWRRIEHDMLDSEYVILASLSGALACNENRMREFFHLIHPDGLLLTCKK
jgi:hypothetical protein